MAVALRSRMPESPRWLMLHDRYADTRKAFGQLGMETTEEEIRTAAEQLQGHGGRTAAQDAVDTRA